MTSDSPTQQTQHSVDSEPPLEDVGPPPSKSPAVADAPPREDEPVGSEPQKVAAAAVSGKSRSKPPKPRIESIEGLVTEAYESKAHLVTFATEKLKTLPVADDQIDTQSRVVSTLGESDPTLNGPFKLLQYVASRGVPLGTPSGAPLEAVLARLRDLAVFALVQHPVFRDRNEELIDPQRGSELTCEVIRNAVERLSVEDGFKESDKARLLRNAITCLALLRVLQGAWDVDRFIDETHANYWSQEVPKAIGAEKAAGLVSASRDPDMLGLLANAYNARIDAQDQVIQSLKREANLSARREERLTRELQDATARERALAGTVDDFSAQIVRLKKDLAAERDNRVVDKSHMADDYETLRTRLIRRLTGEIDLLTDALHALRNGASPVAEEFLDRSLLALSREVEQLKDAVGGVS